MSGLDDVKKAAEDYMVKHIQLWTLMESLDDKELAEFMEWFSTHPQNITMRKFFKSVVA